MIKVYINKIKLLGFMILKKMQIKLNLLKILKIFKIRIEIQSLLIDH